MNLAIDIQAMISLSAPFAGGLPTSVTLPTGEVVPAIVSVASQVDTLIHESIVSGQTRKLTFSTVQIPSLKSQQNLTWNGQLWGVLTTDLEANGAVTACFIGTAF